MFLAIDSAGREQRDSVQAIVDDIEGDIGESPIGAPYLVTAYLPGYRALPRCSAGQHSPRPPQSAG